MVLVEQLLVFFCLEVSFQYAATIYLRSSFLREVTVVVAFVGLVISSF
jgi:hypothetical protein